jgi:hypothetical protein
MEVLHFSADWKLFIFNKRKSRARVFKEKGTSPCRKSGLKAGSN